MCRNNKCLRCEYYGGSQMFHLFLVPSIIAENNYCLTSVSSSLLNFTRFIQGIYNTCIWIRSPIPIKHYLLIVIEFFSKLKVSFGPSNNNHCKLLMANVLQWKQGPMLIRRSWWGWSHVVVGHLCWNAELLFHKEMEWYCD
jgi:hypothetical protein